MLPEKQRSKSDSAEKQANATDVEPGEIVTDSEPVELPSRSEQSSREVSTPSGVLASFEPRRENQTHKKQTNASLPTRRVSENFVGFGHETSSQDAAQDTAIKPPKQEPKSNGTSQISTTVKPAEQSTGRSLSGSAPSNKRPPDAFTGDRRPTLSNMPKIQKRSSVASPQSPEGSGVQQLPAVGDERPPKWYKDTAIPKSRGKNQSNADVMLQGLRAQIKKCTGASDQVDRASAFTLLRDKLHKIVFCEVTAPLLKLHRMLHDDSGLPLLFDPARSRDLQTPFDIKADAEELYNKWCRRVFETDILRGIKFSTGKKTSENSEGASILPGYKVDAKYFGNGDLLNGQWWPLQITALRDGAHGVSQGGISGKPGDGTFSCIMSGGLDSKGVKYPDEDDGDVVLYTGTDSSDGKPTAYTQRMLESVRNHPVRLLRSHALGSKWAPKKGYRYDGLYDVESVEKLDPDDSLRQRHRFKLVRQSGQDKIRGGDGPEARPTKQELDEYEKHKKLSGKAKGLE